MRLVFSIKKLVKKIKYKKRISKFVNFCDETSGALLNIRGIDYPSKDMLDFINLIKDDIDYKAIFDNFNDMISKINDHNAKVALINETVESFDSVKILSNPENYSIEYFFQYKEIIQTIESFGNIDIKFSDFIEMVNDLKENFPIINEQFELLKALDNNYEIFINKDSYLDGNDEIEITNLLCEFDEKLKGYSKVYYKIWQFEQFKSQVDDHNLKYIDAHMNDDVFKLVNGNELADDQKRAILCDSVSNLVIAGAGAGKTLTICGKAKWLLEYKKVQKEDILFLSYSNFSTTDLKTKLDSVASNLNVSTFHSLGLKILETHDKFKQNVEANDDAIIERFFSEAIHFPENELILKKVLNFYAFYSGVPEKKEYKSKGEMFEDLKRSDFSTLKNALMNLTNNFDEKETIKKERVKSYEELVIANFYFLNGINYRYELPFKEDTTTPDHRQYNPDFTLPDYEIYHEHFGVDRNGRSTQFSKEEEKVYLEGIKWKDEIHSLYKTKIVKTFSYEFREGSIFENLKNRLDKLGVDFKPLNSKEIRDALNSIYNGKSFKSFIRLVKSFINLYKTRYKDNSFFDELKKETFNTEYETNRARLFLEISECVYMYYKKELGGKIDFDDMIFKAIEVIPSLDSFKYKYIIVDEFQDISFSRMRFLQCLIRHGNSKLLAVGDDWQSIYRFAGCDLGIFLNFGDNFGMHTISKLTSNHRNPKRQYEISEKFITSNPEQIKKEIVCKSAIDGTIKIVYFDDNKCNAFDKALIDIANRDKNASVLLLGRNNFDIDEIMLSKKIRMERNGNFTHSNFPNLRLCFKTVHSSKGLEEDYVIIINTNDSKTGFPNKIEDDPILSLVLSDKSRFKFAEERRLFYVATTRAKINTYLLVDKNSVSTFVEEVIDDCEILNSEIIKVNDKIIYCPECKTGHLVKKQGNRGVFYGCTNFPYCGYSNSNVNAVETSKRCPRCDHFILWREGPYKKFLGCSNFPRCKYTPEKYEYDDFKPTNGKRQ